MMTLVDVLRLPAPVILASQSPRRKMLLEQIGIPCTVVPAHLDEEEHAVALDIEQYASYLALMKARSVAERQTNDCIVIGSDTIVVLDKLVLNKPVDAADAARMLRLLSNRCHTVITGVAVIFKGREVVRQKQTLVSFRSISEEEIQAYIRSGSPMDKAGAYGIQDDYGAVFVQHVEGCYYNIVGLPLEMLYQMLVDISS